MQTIDENKFDDIISSGDAWLIDFFAPVNIEEIFSKFAN